MIKFVERKGSFSYKWDTIPKDAPEDTIPLWVADMDFSAPKEVIESIKKRADHGVFGYTFRREEYFTAFIKWMEDLHSVEIKKEWILPLPGVVFGIAAAIRTFTDEGDGIIIQPPVYWPFFSVITENKRKIVENPLIYENGEYRMDYRDLAEKMKSAEMMILCSPHNPVGRVWEEDELLEVLKLAKKHDVIIVSDEIHADLTYKKFRTILEFKDIYDKIIVLNSPSKTFNIPSFYVANAMIVREDIKSSLESFVKALHVGGANPLAVEAVISAYKYGKKWLLEVLEYVKDNMKLVKKWADSRSFVEAYIPEGTYLMWLDFRKSGFSSNDLFRMLLKEGVWLQNGKFFGTGGEGFMRINVATSREILREALRRIDRVFQ